MGANIDSTQRRCTIPSRRGLPFILYKTGLLKVVRLEENGTPFLFNIIVPGETIPHHSLISPKEYHGTAIALIKQKWNRSLVVNGMRDFKQIPNRMLTLLCNCNLN